MAIGTEVKVGFEGKEVEKGLGKIRGLFKGATSSFGKGMMMAAGAVSGKSLIDIALKLATGTQDLAEYSGQMEDIALQTGSTVSEVVKLDRALQMAGAKIDAGRVLSTLSNKIYDATHGAQDLQDAFAKANVSAGDLAGLKPMRQFMLVMQGLSKFSGGMEELNQITSEIFGGKMGMQSIRLFKNEDVLNQFGGDVGIFSDRLQENALALGGYADQIERLPYVWRSFNLLVSRIIGQNGETLKGMIDSLLNVMNAEDATAAWSELITRIKNTWSWMKSTSIFGDMSEIFREMGRVFGEGIKDSIKSLKLSDVLLGSNQNQNGDLGKLVAATNESNNILRNIERSNNRYA